MTCHVKLTEMVLTPILSRLRDFFETKLSNSIYGGAHHHSSCTLWLNLDRPESYEGMGVAYNVVSS